MPDADPAVEVLGELDQDRRDRFEVGAGEPQRVVRQVLLRLGQFPHQRGLDAGDVLLEGALEAIGTE